MVVNKRITRMN